MPHPTDSQLWADDGFDGMFHELTGRSEIIMTGPFCLQISVFFFGCFFFFFLGGGKKKHADTGYSP